MKNFKKTLSIALVALFLVSIFGFKDAKAVADSGTSSATMTLVVPVVTTVTCTSASVTAAAGTNTLTVQCTLAGNPNSLASGTANSFGPSSATLTNGGGQTLTASLQSSVTSPDGSMSGITGTSGGFTASINSVPAKIQATYTVPTTSTTKSGTYTGTTTYTWSTI